VPNSTSPASNAGVAAWTGILSRPAARHTSNRSPPGEISRRSPERASWALLALIAFGVVFTKLGITSRKSLHDTLPPRGGSTAPESQQDGRA
jgi:hypothetical protein